MNACNASMFAGAAETSPSTRTADAADLAAEVHGGAADDVGGACGERREAELRRVPAARVGREARDVRAGRRVRREVWRVGLREGIGVLRERGWVLIGPISGSGVR